MTFEEWSDLLELRAMLTSGYSEVENNRAPWRCCGPCGQLMYGIEWEGDKFYPVPYDTPAGLFISKDIVRVCHVCWEMYHACEKSPTGYWQGLAAGDQKKIKGLKPGDNYLTT